MTTERQGPTSLLVCDEAVSSLDVSVRTQILNLLGDLRHQLGLSNLFISHDLATVSQVCDRVIVLYGGKVVEEGDADTVLDGPRHPYTTALLSAAPTPDPLSASGARSGSKPRPSMSNSLNGAIRDPLVSCTQ